MNNELVQGINWLGHDSFRIDAEKTIYIDPFQIRPGPKADIILITHEHYDHCSPADIDKIKKDDTIFITEKMSAAKLDGDVRIVKAGDSISVLGITIEAVPAYNIDKKFHPKENGWLGYIIELDGKRIYHSGDSDFIPEMKNIKTDVALLPVSGTYVMTSAEAAEAAMEIQPKIAIPMHYGAIVGNEQDAIDFQNTLQGKLDVQILKPV